MKFQVKVMPRPEALDPQGRAVQGALNRLGFKVSDCQVGKVVFVDLPDVTDKKEGLKLTSSMAEKILANPLIEIFEVECL